MNCRSVPPRSARWNPPTPRRRSPARPRGSHAVMVSLALLAVSAFAATAQDLPRPPAGFTWERLPEIKGAVLRPAGWRLAPDRTGQGWGYRISETGKGDPASVEIHVLLGLGPTPARDAAQFASDFLAQMSASFRAERTWGGSRETYAMRAGFFADNQDVKSPRKAFLQVLVDQKTRTLVVVSFASPARDWDEEWKIGEAVCENLILPDEAAIKSLRAP